MSHYSFSYSICSCTAFKYTHILGQPLHFLLLYLFLHCFQVHSYPWSAITHSHTLPVPALLPGTLISLVSHYSFSYSTCSCTASKYTHILGKPLHLLILYLCLHCCQVHSYPWSAITASHTLPVPTLLPGTLISLVSHYTFSYSTCSCTAAKYTHTLVSHYTFSYSTCSCTAAKYTHILGQPLHLLILFCSCTASRYTHTLSQPLHLLILYLFLHCCLVHSYPWSAILILYLFLHCFQVHSYPWSAITPSHTLPVPALLPGTLISLVIYYTSSYSTCSWT